MNRGAGPKCLTGETPEAPLTGCASDARRGFSPFAFPSPPPRAPRPARCLLGNVVSSAAGSPASGSAPWARGGVAAPPQVSAALCRFRGSFVCNWPRVWRRCLRSRAAQDGPRARGVAGPFPESSGGRSASAALPLPQRPESEARAGWDGRPGPTWERRGTWAPGARGARRPRVPAGSAARLRPARRGPRAGPRDCPLSVPRRVRFPQDLAGCSGGARGSAAVRRRDGVAALGPRAEGAAQRHLLAPRGTAGRCGHCRGSCA